MKKKLNEPYRKVKRSVIITITATFAVIGFNAIINYATGFQFSVFWVYSFIPIANVDTTGLILEALLSFFNV